MAQTLLCKILKPKGSEKKSEIEREKKHFAKIR
jgi:hypothetical protein